LHKASSLPKEEFKGEVEKHLTGRATEPWELIYFKIYKSQLSLVEQALETAGLMLGTNKSRGYCLEMICADFLAGANVDEANPEALMLSLHQIYRLLRPWRSKTNSGTRLRARCVEPNAKTAAVAIGSRGVPSSPPAGSRQGPLVLSELRHVGKSTRLSYPVAKQTWG
jgi:hypothetical protein